MFCDEALESIEAIAAGDTEAQGRVARHLASCRNCAAALEHARRVDRLLKDRPVPSPPAQFTSRTMARVRRARWRSEQVLDAGFNIAIALVLFGIAGAVLLTVYRSGLPWVVSGVFDIAGRGTVTLVRRAARWLPLYGAAAGVVLGALGLWWWAERDAAM